MPVVVRPKSDAVTRSAQPANQLVASLSSFIKSKFIVGSQKSSSSKLPSVPVRKHVAIFVSRLDPCVTSALLESELFNGYSDVTISKMVTRHPSYSSFHVCLPAEKLDTVLDPVFWPDGVMVKRFWGPLAPEMIQNTTPKKLISSCSPTSTPRIGVHVPPTCRCGVENNPENLVSLGVK